MGMFAVTLIRGYELKLQTEVVRALDRTLSSRSVPEFSRALLRGVLISVGGGVLRLVFGYLQARLSWKWRYKLTNLFHEKYFAGMNYYWCVVTPLRMHRVLRNVMPRAQTVVSHPQAWRRRWNGQR